MVKKIGTMTADLRLESAAFMRDMSRASKAVQTNTFKMRQSMQRLQRSAAAVQKQFSQLRAGAGVLAGALAMRQFAQATKKSLEFADSIAKTADSVGLTTKELQQYQVAAGLSGVSADKFNSSIQRFAKNIGEARAGTGTLVTFMKKTDEAFLQQLTRTRTTSEALQLYLTRLSETAGATDQAALAAAAFGRSGVSMTNMLRDGIQGLADMKQQALDLGLVLKESLLRQAEAVNDRMSLLKNAFDVGFGRSIILQFAGAFELTKENIEKAKQVGENFGRQVGAAMMGVYNAAVFVGRYIREIVAAFTALIALKIATVFIATGVAIVKFSLSLVAAGKAGVLLNLIMSTSVIGVLVRIAAAVVTAAIVLNTFANEFDDTRAAIGAANGELNAFNRSIDETVMKHGLLAGLSGISKGTNLASISGTLERDAEAEAQRRASELETLQASLRTTEEAELFSYQTRLQQLAEFRAQQLISAEAAAGLKERIESDHLEFIHAGQVRAMHDEIAMRKQTVNLAVGLLQQFAGKSRAAAIAAIALNKAVMIANTIQNTAAAAAAAIAPPPLGLGPISGAPYAAAAMAFGAAQVALIAATGLAQASMSGGSSSAALSIASGSNIQSDAVSSTSATADAAPSQTISITLQGERYSSDQVRELIEVLNDAVSDGDKIVVVST